MVSFTLEFETETDVREATRCLLADHAVTGEIGCRRLQNGRWRLDVASERELKDSVLDAFRGRRITGSADVAGE